MSILCKMKLHAWDGCMCRRCASKRDEVHDWAGCKCRRCAKERDAEHTWKGCRCASCGKTRDEGHSWQGCKCSVCGNIRDVEHKWEGCKCLQCDKIRDKDHSWTGELVCARCKCPKFADVVYKSREMTNGNTYIVYSAPGKPSALSYLRERVVNEERVYVVVETPEGNFGKDMIMIFDERTQVRLEYGLRAPLSDRKPSLSRCTNCGYPVLPVAERGARFQGSHGSDEEDIKDMDLLKEKGVGFLCSACRATWCPFCVDASKAAVCPQCQKTTELLSDARTFHLTLPVGDAMGETCPKCGRRVAKLIPVTDYPSGKRRLVCHACSGAVSGAVGEVYNL